MWSYCQFVSPAVDDEVLSPGPDGRLISTDERMEQVRQAQAESPAPTSTDGQSVCMYDCH